jgi:hypothetical protein
MTPGTERDLVRQVEAESQRELDTFVPNSEPIEDEETTYPLQRSAAERRKSGAPQRSNRLKSPEPNRLSKPQTKSPEKALAKYNASHDVSLQTKDFQELVRALFVSKRRRAKELPKGLQISLEESTESVTCPVKNCSRRFVVRILATLQQQGAESGIVVENLHIHSLVEHPERNLPGETDALALLNVLTEKGAATPKKKKVSKKKASTKKKTPSNKASSKKKTASKKPSTAKKKTVKKRSMKDGEAW